jgi:protoporphyrin/coproporphyrin ferrochelatase
VGRVVPAVLLTCHGTVEDTADVPGFLANIRRGRPTPPELVDEVVRRFRHIGGSPLMRITREQGAALEARLGLPVRVAGRLWGPYPAEVLAQLADEGIDAVVSLPLAPQSVGVYHAAVRQAAAAIPALRLEEAPPWGLEPALVEAFEEAILEALARFPAASRAAVPILLTAHSLPSKIVDAGDPYEREFRAMAAAVAARLAPRGNPVSVAFQSQGATGDAWLGPDLPASFARLREEGARDVLVAPIGFVAEHVETLYDLDVEAKKLAADAGFDRFERAAACDTRPRFIDALEQVSRACLGRL